MYDLASGESETGFRTFDDGLARTILAAEAAHRRDGQLIGISTGLPSLDRLLGGLHKSDSIALAARPSMGKTALATNMGSYAARNGVKVGFFSLEMSDEQLVTRIVAEQPGVPSERVRRGELTSVEFDRVASVVTALQGLPLFIDPTPAAQARVRPDRRGLPAARRGD